MPTDPATPTADRTTTAESSAASESISATTTAAVSGGCSGSPGPSAAPPTWHELVLAHRPLVGHIVREVLSRLPAHVDRGDLLSAGLMALTVAARSCQPDRGVPFARWAAIRVRGAITDELRGLDWASRGVRSRARTIDEARSRLHTDLGRAATDLELQAATGLSAAELEASAADTARAAVLSLHTPVGDDASSTLTSAFPDPAGLLVEREALGYLDDAIEELPDRLRFVVRGYFFDQRPMAELAADLGVTDSRISQLRAEAVRLLRAGLHEPLHGTPEPTTPKPSTPGTTSTTTFGPRVAAARQDYIAAVAARSTATTRLRHTTTLAEPHPRQFPSPAAEIGEQLEDAS